MTKKEEIEKILLRKSPLSPIQILEQILKRCKKKIPPSTIQKAGEKAKINPEYIKIVSKFVQNNLYEKKNKKKTLCKEGKVFRLNKKDMVGKISAKKFIETFYSEWKKQTRSYYFSIPLTYKWKKPLEEIKSEMIRIFGMFSSKEKIKEINNAFDEWVQHSQRIELLPKAKKLKPLEIKRKEKFPLSEDRIDSIKTLKRLGAIKKYKINKKDKIVEITRADFLVHKPVKYTQKQLERAQKFREDCDKESFNKNRGEENGFDVIQIEYYKKHCWTGDRSLRPINQIEIIDTFFRDFYNSLNKLHKLLLAFPKSLDQEKINNFVKIYKIKSL